MIKFGVSPIAWSNDDLPSLGKTISLTECLNDIHALGFEGVELGGKFPRDAKSLTALLQRRRLELVGGWYSTNLLTHDAETEIERLQDHLNLLIEMGCSVFIAAETSNAIHSDIDSSMSQKPNLLSENRDVFCDRMSKVADYISEKGLLFAYHHHLGTVVETAKDLDWFLKLTSPNVKLTLDTGHAVGGGIDPIRIIMKHPDRIAHVHCKDLRMDTFNETVKNNDSFLKGVAEGMFTVPGDGNLDFSTILKALKKINYLGWIIIEAEQDSNKADPKAYADVGLRTLRELAAQVDLT